MKPTPQPLHLRGLASGVRMQTTGLRLETMTPRLPVATLPRHAGLVVSDALCVEYFLLLFCCVTNLVKQKKKNGACALYQVSPHNLREKDCYVRSLFFLTLKPKLDVQFL